MSRYKAYSEYCDSGLSWLGKMPNHWKLIKAKYIFQRVQREVRPEDGVVTAFRDGQVTLRTNRRVEGFTESIKEIGYQGVRMGDLLVHAMDGFAGAIGVSDSDGKCSPVCSVCVPVKPTNTHVQYYGYLVRQLAVTDFITSLAKGIRERSTEFRFSEFSGLELAFPPISEQQKITNFLDYETAKIDILIAKQQELIKLLKEKRQAVISHAVTKGLNPNAPMRDSGVEWLGKVPKHWGVKKFRFLCDRIIAGPFGSSITKDMYVKEGYKVYGQEQVIPNDFTIGDYYVSKRDFLELFRYSTNPGDILISCVGTFGKVAVFPNSAEPGIINPRLIKAEVKTICNPLYLCEFLKSEMVFKQFELLSRGGTMGVINIGVLNEILVACPPLEEQDEVFLFIKRQKEKFNFLIERANKQIELAQERRTALISAAVTGKIDVRDWQAPSDTALAA
ncbi:restriction endonuclease subunit S [Undibacterium pigrum]|uniref:Type I restriction enzyme S subunit n=1 Tax=Undibacterium pigrum TaxID=401470 RepID=A0A318IXJ8_9BURK|nr:restriction endonuclease subunit S [Undibacterium pigrum]PXX40035.1 type I restriction enzyme S subunit [Undibacterium pigrum]